MDRFNLPSLLLLLSLLSSVLLSTLATTGLHDEPFIRQVVSSDDEDPLLHAEHHFSVFKSKFGKTYATREEHDYRFGEFKANLRRAKRHQLLDPTAVHGVTKFSDLTPSEFRRQFLGLNRRLRLPPDTQEAPILPTKDLPTEFDWRDHGAVTGIKDQGTCGSCWSFSTTGALEGAHFLATGELVSLSEQQLVDCDHECDQEYDACDSGCNDGLMNSALEYILKAGGLEREEDYPYTGTDQDSCKFDKMVINSIFMQTYTGGVSCPHICGKHLDHGALLVGYASADYAPIRFKDKPFWIIKNSWGENWGENGYYRICRVPNICGVDSLVSSVAAINTASH